MEFRQLSYFLAAVQTQSFRKAAEMCFVAQPALSRQIAALETELGLPLFIRSQQGVLLTPAGREFAIYARNSLEQLQFARLAMAHMQEGLEGTVSVGCVEPLATAFLPALFHRFHQHFPQIRLSVRVSRTDDVLSLVEHAEVDLAFIFEPDRQSELLIIKELFQQPLYLLVSAQHPLALRPEKLPLQLADVLNEPLVLLRETSRLRRRIEQIVSRHGHRLQPIVEIDSLEGLKELVKQGCGITFLPPALVGSGQSIHEFALFPLLDVPEQFSFALAYRALGTTPRPALQFINYALQSTDEK